MKTLARFALSIGAAALFAGCGGSQAASPLPIQPMSQFQNRIHLTGGGYKMLYSFKGGADGASPSGGLTPVDRVLYGTSGGGAYGKGTVFSITPSGTEKVVYTRKKWSIPFRAAQTASIPRAP